MDESKVIALENPGAEERDALTDVLRQGAWRMLAQTVEEEVEAGLFWIGIFDPLFLFPR